MRFWPGVASWVAQMGVAAILAQTLYFKFTYAPETQAIFADRGGRLAATAVGLAELLCVVLLLIPRAAAVGAALALLVIGGALFTHLTSLGIAVTDPATGESDGGLLFVLAGAGQGRLGRSLTPTASPRPATIRGPAAPAPAASGAGPARRPAPGRRPGAARR
jgi:hypothetical protein